MKGVRRLASLPCGGGHRSWCWSVQEDQLSFSFLKDHTAHVLQCPLLKLARPMVKVLMIVFCKRHKYVER